MTMRSARTRSTGATTKKTFSGRCRSSQAPVMVLVTHHLEEVPPGFTHAMLLRDGGVVAAGPIDEVLTAEHLSTTFGVDLDVTENAGRYTATARR